MATLNRHHLGSVSLTLASWEFPDFPRTFAVRGALRDFAGRLKGGRVSFLVDHDLLASGLADGTLIPAPDLTDLPVWGDPVHVAGF
jgi:hypothetical protein